MKSERRHEKHGRVPTTRLPLITFFASMASSMKTAAAMFSQHTLSMKRR